MFTSVTAGDKNNIYFLDKWSGFLGQFNVIGLYNKKKVTPTSSSDSS